MELLELRTCLTVAEKALLWQALRIGLEATMVLEASIMYTDDVELRLSERSEAIDGCEIWLNGCEEEALKLRQILEICALCRNNSSLIT